MRNEITLRSLGITTQDSFADEVIIKNIVVDKDLFSLSLSTGPLDREQTEQLIKILSAKFPGWEIEIDAEEFALAEPEPETTTLPIEQIVTDYLIDQLPSLKGFAETFFVQVEKEILLIQFPNPLLEERFFEMELDENLRGFLSKEYPTSHFQLKVQSETDLRTEDSHESLDLFIPVKVQVDPKRARTITSDDYDRWSPGSRKNDPPLTGISELSTNDTSVTVIAEITEVGDPFITKRNRVIYSFDIYDQAASTSAKYFTSMKEMESGNVKSVIKAGNLVKLYGEYTADHFSRCDILRVYKIEEVPTEREPNRLERGLEERVELHLHTSMSALDGLIKPEELFPILKSWGHNAVAITDHGVVQSFPDIAEFSRQYGIKPIYGMEAYVVEERPSIMKNTIDESSFNAFVVFDLETTGLSQRSDKIIEIGAVKLVDGKVMDRFSAFIDPEEALSHEIITLTGITDAHLKGQPTIDAVLPEFLEFAKGSVLVAHNADFDISFVSRDAKNLGYEWNFPSFDTLALAQLLFPDQRSHRLDRLTKQLGIPLSNHHRALDDAEATAKLFVKLLKIAEVEPDAVSVSINEIESERNPGKNRPVHVNLLAKNLVGLRNLYELVTKSHLNTFYMTPRVTWKDLRLHREGLLLGSSCADGAIVQAILNGADEETLLRKMEDFDYIELQPIENWVNLVTRGYCKGTEDLKEIQKEIVRVAKLAGKTVVATSDAHILRREDAVFRDIIKSGKKMTDPKQDIPMYLRSTDDMLHAFGFLGEEVAEEIVIHNTNQIADLIEAIVPVLPGTHPPRIEGSEKTLRDSVYETAHRLYGDPLPEIVSARIERELHSIISHGYAVMYIIAQKLVKKSNDDGYVVGSRGSVGSSLAATFSGITEVNPLVPHYLCETCKHSEFVEDGSVDTGVDLPLKDCPHCHAPMHQDGHDIPFEVFLGFEGDKEPDIDLNFAGEYQSKAHKYVESLFGGDKVIRAGTIGTIQSKTAFGYVKKYLEEKHIHCHPAEERRLMRGILDVKRASSQHPGGIMIVPQERHIHDFTPIQHPADSSDTSVITTHFSYKKIHESILKLDILGHDVPTTIRLLEDMTGIKPDAVPMRDPDTMEIFSGQNDPPISTLGIPEFGTQFVQGMLAGTHPKTFGELVRISGLSHGTDVWLGNAKDLIDSGTAQLRDTICTRDDIMRSLILAGLEKKMSFQIMENVRKGRGLTPEMVEQMRAKEVPEWYIDSCKKIKYMFPKSHAVAYVLMSYRIAWFKVHRPAAFYASFFTIKIQDIPKEILQGQRETTEAFLELSARKKEFTKLTAKEEAEMIMLDVASEMYRRGITIGKFDLYDSPALQFSCKEDVVIPPLRAIPGVSDAMAQDLGEERHRGPFTSKDDLLARTKLNKNAMEGLAMFSMLDDLPDTNQLSFF